MVDRRDGVMACATQTAIGSIVTLTAPDSARRRDLLIDKDYR
jgi:hypothetical protein